MNTRRKNYHAASFVARFTKEFLRRVAGLTRFSQVGSTEICKSLNIEPLLLHIERLELRRLHVTRMPQNRCARQILYAKPTGKRPYWTTKNSVV